MTKVVNLTPHTLNLLGDSGEAIAIAASGKIARVSETIHQVESVLAEGIELPVVYKTFGEVIDLPEAGSDGDAVYVVSAMVASAVWQSTSRTDVYCPGIAIRDDQGRVIGAKGLSAKPRG